jgi:glycosyltransferase involved in cell wall biosynthesis
VEPPASERARALALAWARFQPRTEALAHALGGRAAFVPGPRRPLPLRYLACALETWRLLRSERPERVLVVTPPVVAPLVAWAWCRRQRAALVVDCHTDAFHAARWRWARPLHRFLLRRARAALVHTEEAEELVRTWGAPGLLLPDDVPDVTQAGVAAGSERPVVLVAGSLDGNEPVAETVAAAALAPELEFRLTGDVERVPGPVQAAAPPNAVFTGFLPYERFLGEMLAARAVAVFSTDPHIMNRAAFEAAGMGRPLVLSDLPGLRSRFGDEALYTANRPAEMAAAVRRAVAAEEELAGRSRELAARLRRQRAAALDRLRAMLAPPPARVLRITQHAFPGMPVVRRDVLELLERGYEVDLICLRHQPHEGEPPVHPRLHVHRVPIRHRRRLIRYPFEYSAFFAWALAVASWLGLRHRYAAVQVDNLPDHLVWTALVPRWRGARCVLNLYELTPEMVAARVTGGLRRPLLALARAVERLATSWADRVVVVSRSCFEALQERGVPAERMSIVVNSYPLPVSPRRHPPSSPLLITHGTLVRRYGIDQAIRALALLAPAWPDLRLAVMGDGEQRPALEALARELGLGDRVEFTGWLPWAKGLERVRRATLCLVPVLGDGYGRFLLPTKLLEAVQLGVPVVCSRLPAIEAYFPEGVSYARSGDARDLADRIHELLSDPERACRQAERAAELGAELAWERVRERYLEALGLALPEPVVGTAAS